MENLKNIKVGSLVKSAFGICTILEIEPGNESFYVRIDKASEYAEAEGYTAGLSIILTSDEFTAIDSKAQEDKRKALAAFVVIYKGQPQWDSTVRGFVSGWLTYKTYGTEKQAKAAVRRLKKSGYLEPKIIEEK